MAARSKLTSYRAKRDFQKTREPAGKRGQIAKPRSFVVQAHHARRMHYDFRLELDGVLVSWAVPKGPSLDPKIRRLAVQTEDHPIEYANFEGVIPKGEYGAGKVIVWDHGTWSANGDPKKALEEGRLRFDLEGEKLHGRFNLIRTRGELGEKSQWLLIKSKDERARAGSDDAIVRDEPESVISGRTLEHADAQLPDPSSISGAKKKRSIGALEPELATLSAEVPEGDAWIHEVKLDGYRILAQLEDGEVRLFSRNGHDWTERAPSIARILARWRLESAALDGELVVLDRRGISRFQALQNALSDAESDRLVYFAFDLLHLNGFDLRGAPLVDRKRALSMLLDAMGPNDRVRPSEHTVGRGREVLRHACELGLEGVVSKRAASPYRSGRGRDWQKIKCHVRQEVVIAGWTEPKGSRAGIGALLVGVHDDEGALRFAGRVGTGFTARSLDEMHRALEPLAQKTAPFVDPPRGAAARGVHWVEPKLLAEIEATERTKDGKFRHPSFKGLRTDKPARAITMETPKLRLTNPDRELFPGKAGQDAITKRELAAYYQSVAQRILPHVQERLLTLVRCPDGATGKCFYQRHAHKSFPTSVRSMSIEDVGDDASEGSRQYVYVSDLEGLIALVQSSVLEIHVWGSRIETIELPDRLVFDLDPDPKLAWTRVVQGAIEVRDRLAELGLKSFVKSTGGKGLHVVVPIEPRLAWDGVKNFCHAIADQFARRSPRSYVAVATKARRTNRIFIDYLRNGRAATAVAAYSTRAQPGAPIATPLRWEDLESQKRPVVTLRESERWLAEDDPWPDFFEVRQSITERAMRRVGAEEQ